MTDVTELPTDAKLDNQDIDPQTFRSIIRSMAQAGSSPAELQAYASQHGYSLSGDVSGSVKSAQAGQPFSVIHNQPDQVPDGYEELPDDAGLDHEGEQGGFWHDAAVVGRGFLKGVSDLSDLTFNAGPALAAKIVGSPSLSQEIDAQSKQYNIGQPRSSGERVLEAAGQGAGFGLPFGGEGMVPALLGGAGSGAASKAAQEAGYGSGAQILAGIAGGGFAGLLPSAASRTAGAFGQRTLTPTMQAFADEGVPALAADVGGRASRMASGFANMTLGGIPLAEAAERSVAAAKGLRSKIADRIGTPARDIAGRSDSVGAGLAAQKGVKASLGAGGTKQAVGERLYNAIPIKPGTKANLTNTRSALDDLTAGYSSNPALSALTQDNRLQGYRDALKDGDLSWGDLKSFRSYVGELAGRPTLQDSTAKDALQRLYGGLSEDMRATASAQGDGALKAFTRANNYWRGLESRRQQVLQPLLGKDLTASGEDAFRQIERWSSNNGDVFALGRSLRSMPEDEANRVRATLFDRLGTVSKGRQDETGTVFSPNDFVNHWQGLSSRAKSVLFPGAEYRNSIDNLVKIASAQKGAQQYANVSKTGNAVNGIALLTGFFSNPLATLPVAIGQLGFGKLMSSARVARWLASAPSKPNPSAALAHINRLSAIAGSEPAIANEVLHLQERLASAFTAAPMKAAAEPSDEITQGQGNTVQDQSQYQDAQP